MIHTRIILFLSLSTVLLLTIATATAATAAENNHVPTATGTPWQRLDAALRLTNENPAAAQRAIENLLSEHPTLDAAHYDLGCLKLATDPVGAARHFAQASASENATLAAKARFNLALALADQGRLQQAAEAAQKAFDSKPDDPDYILLRDELRRRWLIAEDEKRRQAEEAARKLRLTTKQLPPARHNKSYRSIITATGGSPPYSFATTDLPPGLSMDAQGSITGTPDYPENKNTVKEMTINVIDDSSTAIQGTVRIPLWPAIHLPDQALPEAIIGFPYSAPIVAHGLINPTWAVTPLPAGLRLERQAGKAIITGTPERIGTHTLLATVKDSDSATASATLGLIVSDSFAPAETRLHPATAWARYEFINSIRGAPAEYSWSGAAGGLRIDNQGKVTGIPEEAGLLELPITITRKRSDVEDSRSFTLHVPVNTPPIINESDTISLKTNQPIQRQLNVLDGTPPYTWSITDNTLPDGLQLTPNGQIIGVVADSGSVDVSFHVHDHWKAQTQETITLEFTTPEEDNSQNQQQEDQQQANNQQQNDSDKQNSDSSQNSDSQEPPKDQQQQQNQQSQANNQKNQQDPNGQEQNQDDTQGDSQQPPQTADSDQQGNEESQRSDEPLQARDAGEAAAEQFLNALPDERDNLRRYQLLRSTDAPKSGQQPW